MSKFQPYGPYVVPIEDGALESSGIPAFWKHVEKSQPGLSDSVGCYIFAIRAGKGIRPWYVGKTAKMSFKREIFQDNKFRIYFKILKARAKGTALMFLIAKHTPHGRLSTSGGSVRELEEMLIGTCLSRNPKLVNKSMTKHLRQIQVPGYMNESKGARSRAARELAKLLGVAKPPRDSA